MYNKITLSVTVFFRSQKALLLEMSDVNVIRLTSDSEAI